MGKGWTPLRWLLQPFTTGMAASAAQPQPSARSRDRVTRALADVTAAPLDPIAQAAVNAFVSRLVAEYEPAAFVTETALETVGGSSDRQQIVLVYPKGRRRDGESRRCEELTAALLPAGTAGLAIHQAEATGHAMRKQIETRLKQDAGWVDAELEAGLKLGFPADWRDYRFVG